METIEKLKAEIEQIKSENKNIKYKLLVAEEQIKYFKDKLFGTKSEKRKQDDSPDLFDEAEMSGEKDDDNTPPEKETVTYVRDKRKRGKREVIPESFPRNDKVVDISDEEKKCACGCQMTKIGEEITEKFKVIPAKIEVERTIRPKYACKSCQGIESEGVHPTVKIAPLPH